MRVSILFIVALPWFAIAQPTAIPDGPLDLLYTYCFDCHDETTTEAGLNLDVLEIDWGDAHAREHWTDIYTRIVREKMPPKDKDQPTPEERQQLLAWLDKELMAHSPVGGVPMRRLNRREYRNSLKSVFPIIGFELPPGFPADNESHGFDTVSDALVISASHLEAYRETATDVADYLFPQPRVLPATQKVEVGVDDISISYSSGAKIDGAMRLASSGIMVRNAVWLSKFEAPVSGTYRVTMDLSAMNPPPSETPVLHLEANALSGKKTTRTLGAFEVASAQPEGVAVDVELYRGETLVFTYKNAPLNYGNKETYYEFIHTLLSGEPALAAAWQRLDDQAKAIGATRGVPRGGGGWIRLKEERAKQPDAVLPIKKLEALVKKIAGNSVSSGETIVYKYFEEGPNIGIHGVTVEGPFELVDDPTTIAQSKAKQRFIGDFINDEVVDLEGFFNTYLAKLFRRPATWSEVQAYVAIVRKEQAAGYTMEDGLHLAVRTSLLSSSFLYKESGSETVLSAYELASRLSYFLTSGPPDYPLLSQARVGAIAEPTVLVAEVKRLLKAHNKTFATDFTSLWLDVHLLDTIVPDSKLLSNYNKSYRQSLKDEVVLTFQEILKKNQPVSQFIDPDFLYTNPTVGWELYELKQHSAVKLIRPNRRKQEKLTRHEIPRGTRHGGLLGMPAVMLATANGVDTQPVLRGVWMLENIIGRPPPAPPNSVPALSPDLTGATTLKERLAAHMADKSCASCHEDIDPIGFVFENFDAVGRWRTEYPPSVGGAEPLPVDATGVLPEGTKLNDVSDLKRWLVEHPEHFANCLAEKLMIYGTGRELNYREKKMLKEIVSENLTSELGFADLLGALVQSEIFLKR